MKSILQIWEQLSRNGLRDNEGVFEHREVIFLNKILVISPIVIALIIPLEIFLNGFQLVPLEVSLILLILIPLALQRYRYFWAARLFSFIIGNSFIIVAGILVGKGVNNHIAMIPLMLFGMIIFKNTRDRVLVLFISVLFYLTLYYCLETIPPAYNVSPENKEKFTFIFYLMTLLLTFLLGYYSLAINREFEKLIITQKEGLALKNKEITDSINYAKRIQNAKLPKKEEIYNLLPQSFVLFKPKDIVSGDFYSIHKTQNEIIIAAADCTGHGVPGALMSMVGSEQLNKAVLQSSKISEILQLLNQGIKSSLRQTSAGESTRDGMDIALCSVNTKEGVVKFGGANRPLWVVRNGQASIEEIKPTKNAIGGLTEHHSQFESHELKLQPGDSFYIFTDGYPDQFGGQSGKKLMTKKFKEILLSIKHLPMPEQEKHLDQFIENWKGRTEQVDDILVIGVKL